MRKTLLAVLAGAVLAFGQATPVYPTSVASWEDLLVAVDNSASTLTADIGAGDLSMTVADGSRFVTWEQVTIDAEQIQVCSVNTNTLTVCPGGRGLNGTTAVAHAAGSAVRGTNTAAHHNRQAAEIIAMETALGAGLGNVLKPDAGATLTDGDVAVGTSTGFLGSRHLRIIPQSTNWEAQFGTGTSTYVSTPNAGTGGTLNFRGVTSDFRISVQDNAGRMNMYWNAYYDTPAIVHRCIVGAGEYANRWNIYSGGTTAQYLGGPCTNAGDSITWRSLWQTNASGSDVHRPVGGRHQPAHHGRAHGLQRLA